MGIDVLYDPDNLNIIGLIDNQVECCYLSLEDQVFSVIDDLANASNNL